MQLTKHIQQGSLLYFNCEDDAISVSENEHYVWLAFGDVIQSVMLKRKPYQLTLPHQSAMLLPLLFFKPKEIVELGLGGGNLSRFLKHLDTELTIQSIECNKTVITCFDRYFNPENISIQVHCDRSENWLLQNQAAAIATLDWLVCDIYQTQLADFSQTMTQLESLVSVLSANSCLSINLPDSSDEEVNLCLTVLQQLLTDHQVIYFHIPNYLNIVIQIIPAHWQLFRLLKRNSHSYLPNHLFLKWRIFWQAGIVLKNGVNKLD